MVIPEMLPQQIFAIIISVGSSYCRVNVISSCFPIAIQGNGALVIELDEDHRTVDAVEKDRSFVHLSNPGKVGAIEVLLDFLHLDLGMSFFEIVNPEAGEC